MFYYETEFDYEQVIKLVGIQKNFRYFETRSREIFDSHVYHILLKDESSYVGYGHLDADEQDKLWMGICVFGTQQSKGYGTAILNHLVNIPTKYSKIHVAIDKDNFLSVNMCLSGGFRIKKQTDTKYFCERKYNG